MGNDYVIHIEADHIRLLARLHTLVAGLTQRLFEDELAPMDAATECDTLWRTLRASPFLQPGQLARLWRPRAIVVAETLSLPELDDAARKWVKACRKAARSGINPSEDPKAQRCLERMREVSTCRAWYLG